MNWQLGDQECTTQFQPWNAQGLDWRHFCFGYHQSSMDDRTVYVHGSDVHYTSVSRFRCSQNPCNSIDATSKSFGKLLLWEVNYLWGLGTSVHLIQDLATCVFSVKGFHTACTFHFVGRHLHGCMIRPQDWCFRRTWSSERHRCLTARTDWGTGSSQSHFSLHVHWRRIFGLMIAGEHQPKTSNSVAMSDSNAHLVSISTCLSD